MNPTDLFSAIGSIGFPIVVAWYLMTRIEKILLEIKDLLNKILTEQALVRYELGRKKGKRVKEEDV